MAERIIVKSTPEEAARIDSLAAQIEAETSEIAARLQRMELAEQEAGIRGDLRRVIRDSLIGPDRLSNEAGVDLDRLQQFQEGTMDLPLCEMERLAERLGMHLVASLVSSS